MTIFVMMTLPLTPGLLSAPQAVQLVFNNESRRMKYDR